MALIKCSECRNEVSDEVAVCPICGAAISTINSNIVEQNVNREISINVLNEKKHNKKKLFATIGIIVATMVIVLAVVLIKNTHKGTTYVVKACKELAEDESGLPDIQAIYTSEKAVKAISSEKVDGGFLTIDYVYRVYIEYSSGQEKNAVMYMVDNKGETYYITEHSSERESHYLSLAKMEIFGLKTYWGPNGAWVKLDSSEISKIEEKVK